MRFNWGVWGRFTLTTLALLAGCRSKEERDQTAPTAPVTFADDARPADAAAQGSWRELDELPRAEALRTITLPSRPDVPQFDVGGPAIHKELAVVSSSQFGFIAVDWRRGGIVWTKPAGGRVAPPIVRDGSFLLIGACATPPVIPDDHALLGCMRSVTPAGADEHYVAIHGKAKLVEEFASAAGLQQLFLDGERRVRWRRGDSAVSIDAMSGVATPGPAEPPPIRVTYKDRHWDISQVDGKLVAREKNKVAWGTEHAYTALIGSVWLPGQSPMIRVANVSAHSGTPEIRLLDIDATGSMNGQAAWTPVPGISVLGQAISPVGDVALAIRMDKSIKRDFIAAYAANALLIYVHPLPEVLRADPVGVAIALDDERVPEAVVVFHDGDTVTVLPALSSPPTAPGAARGPLENATP
ncbi:MAG: hypothetical protein H0T42_02145 [Deltaproteobacteria bacterium]|nr:hypothetical protein [Deltaproteobacteria bacterium]